MVAYHKAEYWDDDDDSDSFMVVLRMDIKSTTIIETATQIVKQVSSWRSACITCVRSEPRTTRTTRNALNELSLGARKAEIIGWWHRNLPRAQEAGH